MPNVPKISSPVHVPARVPYDEHLEAACLGSVLLAGVEAVRSVHWLRPEHFWQERHRRIFRAIKACYQAGQGVDVVLVTQRLRDAGHLDLVGGLAYVGSLTNSMPTAANLDFYAERLRTLYGQRAVIELANTAAMQATEPDADPRQVARELSRSLLGCATGLDRRKAYTTPADRQGLAADILAGSLYRGNTCSGFAKLDERNLLSKGRLVLLAARPSMGKTSLLTDIASNVACGVERIPGGNRHDAMPRRPVWIASFEMAEDELLARVIASMARVHLSTLSAGQLDEASLKRAQVALQLQEGAPLIISGSGALDRSLEQLLAIAHELHEQYRDQGGLALIGVDYVQQVKVAGLRHRSKSEEVGEVSASLKQLAGELGTTVMALSQLNRAVESRQNKRPLLSDLRDSGSLEQDSDIVAFLYRDAYYNPPKEGELPGPKANLAELGVAKHRFGRTGTSWLRWRGESTRFEPWPDSYGRYHPTKEA